MSTESEPPKEGPVPVPITVVTQPLVAEVDGDTSHGLALAAAMEGLDREQKMQEIHEVNRLSSVTGGKMDDQHHHQHRHKQHAGGYSDLYAHSEQEHRPGSSSGDGMDLNGAMATTDIEAILESMTYVEGQGKLTRHVRPYELPPDRVQMHKSFGMEWDRRYNVHYIDVNVIIFAVGHTVQTLNLYTGKHDIIHGRDQSQNGGIGSIAVHPTKRFFAVAERGYKPNIYIYSWPDLRVVRILSGGTERSYASINFSPSGTSLASVGGDPDYSLVIWDWASERVVLKTKAFSQEVFRVTFSPYTEGSLITSGQGHIRFWKVANTFTGLKLQGQIGKFGSVELADISAYAELPDGKVVCGTEKGHILLWDGYFIQLQLMRPGDKPCHDGIIEHVSLEGGEIVTAGADGFIRRWAVERFEYAQPDDIKYELAPSSEISLGPNFSVVSMTRGDDHWLIQNKNGGLYKLPIKGGILEPVFEISTGVYTAVLASRRTHTAITGSSTGVIRLWDILEGKSIYSRQFPTAVTTLIRAPAGLDDDGRVFLAGFSDGVVRVLERTASGFGLLNAFKPHSAPVHALAFSPDRTQLVSVDTEGNIFFFEVQSRATSYVPLGFVTFPPPIISPQWSPDSQFVLFGSGSVAYQIQRPDPSHFPDPASRETFRIQLHQIAYRPQIRVLKQITPTESESSDSKKQEGKQGENGSAANGDAKESTEEPINQEYVPDERDDAICSLLYIKNEPTIDRFGQQNQQPQYAPGHHPFYVAFAPTSKGDRNLNPFVAELVSPNAKYETLYECDIGSDEPTKSTYLGADLGVVSSLTYSTSGDLLLVGSRTGSVVVKPLSDPAYYFHLHPHDGFRGVIPPTGLTTTFDDRIVLSLAADGTFFATLTDMESALQMVDREESIQSKFGAAREQELAKQRAFEELRRARAQELQAAQEAAALGDMEPLNRYRASLAIALPQASEFVEDDRIAEHDAADILDSNYYSIEQAKKQQEKDERMKSAEQKKEHIRRKIAELRVEFAYLLKKNASLDPSQQLPRSEFELDSRLKQQFEKEAAERVQEVRNEMAWESEKQKIALEKLRKYFLRNVVCESIELKSFRSGLSVHSYRATAAPPAVESVITDAKALVSAMGGPSAFQDDMDYDFDNNPDGPTSGGSLDMLRPTDRSLLAPFVRLKEDAERERRGVDIRLDGTLTTADGAGKSAGAKLKSMTSPLLGSSSDAEVFQQATIEGRKRRAMRERRQQLQQQQQSQKGSAADAVKATRLEIQKHLEQRPDKDSPTAGDRALIAEFRKNTGDHKLKSDPKFRVPESRRVDVESKRNAIRTLQYATHLLKMKFNERFLKLRDEKRALVQRLCMDSARIAELNQALGIDEPVFMPCLDPAEWPEQRDYFTDADLEAFVQYKEGEKRAAAAAASANKERNIFADEVTTTPSTEAEASKQAVAGAPSGDKPTAGVATVRQTDALAQSQPTLIGNSLSNLAATAGTGFGPTSQVLNFAASAERVLLLQERRDMHAERLAMIPKSELELAEARLERKFLEDERMELITQAEQAIAEFDAKVAELRMEKVRLDVDLKIADLRLITMDEEVSLLKSFEATELRMSRNINALKSQQTAVAAEMARLKNELMTESEKVKSLIEKSLLIDKRIQDILELEKPDQARFLQRLYERKTKRTKRRKRKGAAGADGSGGIDDDDDDVDDDVDDDDEEDADGDDDGDSGGEDEDEACPAGCESTYEDVILIRDDRIRTQEEREELQKKIAELNRAHDRLEQKSRSLARELENAENEADAYQSEKQRALNQIEVVLPLRLSQICREVLTPEGQLPRTLTQALVFPARGLKRLARRILELGAIKQELQSTVTELRNLRAKYRSDLDIQEKEIEAERRQCEELQILKFGQIIDLDMLSKLDDDEKTDALKKQLKEAEAETARSMAYWDARVNEAKAELAEVTRENTRWLERVARLTQAQYQLEYQLNKSTKSVHVTDSSPVDEQTDAERRELLRLVQLQEKEIDSLKAEIHVLRSKGGRVFVPQ